MPVLSFFFDFDDATHTAARALYEFETYHVDNKQRIC